VVELADAPDSKSFLPTLQRPAPKCSTAKIGCVYWSLMGSHLAALRSETQQIANPTDTTTDTSFFSK
jgi:hypothetical protein